jgi:DNA-binding response OmpR family regulator
VAGEAKALVVEDAPEFAEICSRVLAREGFSVTVATDGDMAVKVARRENPEFVLLDISLPGMDGFEVCRRLREFTDDYVVIITGRGGELDKVIGLSVGADDYITKPFSVRELAARLRAMRRRPRAARQPGLREFGRLALDPQAREARVDGSPVDLTKIEFDILDLLSGSPRQVFSRGQILQQVWGRGWYGDDHVIDVHVANLRRKLGESAASGGSISTVRGVGYRFDPPGEATGQ